MATLLVSLATATMAATLSCPVARWICGTRAKTVIRMARSIERTRWALAKTPTEPRAAIRVTRRAHSFNRVSTKHTLTTTMTLQIAMVPAVRVRQLAVLERRLMGAPFDGRHVKVLIGDLRRVYEAGRKFGFFFFFVFYVFVLSSPSWT